MHKKFPYLLKLFMNNWKVDDKTFEYLSLSIDKDEEGNKVRREVGISQESR